MSKNLTSRLRMKDFKIFANWPSSSLWTLRKNGNRPKFPFSIFRNSPPQKLAKRPEMFPQIGNKSVFLLVNRVDLPKNVKDVARDLKVSVDKGVCERKVDVTESTKRVF